MTNVPQTSRSVLVTGATGFVGRALLPELVRAGHQVRATTRVVARAAPTKGVDWIRCDIDVRSDVERALEGVDAAYFLVHGMGGGRHDYAARERRAARQFADIAASARVKRIIYLGGVAPKGRPSEHLKSRLAVGEILRAGSAPALELRASMIIGNGSASWQIIRDLAMRLPAMVLPSWTASRTCPVAIADVVVALVRGLDIHLPKGAWYDIPGPEALSGRDMLLRIAALHGRRVPCLGVPLLSVSLSSWWLKLVARTDFLLARELVLGFTGDLLPEDDRYWNEIGYTPKWTFEAAARQALEGEKTSLTLRGVAGRLGESMVQAVSPKIDKHAEASR